MVSGSVFRHDEPRRTVPPITWLGCACLAVILAARPPAARAATPADNPANNDADTSLIFQMEQHAGQAAPRERCFLYAQVLTSLTELEGRQIAAGEDLQAQATMRRMNEVAAKIQASTLDDAKRLKNAELMLDKTTRRVADMVRVVSAGQRAALQATLNHLNSVHNQVLATVFAH